MIGIGPLASAAGGVLLVAGVVGAGGPDPARTVRADELVTQRREEALAALGAVDAALNRSLDAAREATDAVLDGSDGAGERLLDAADALDAARVDARGAQLAIDALVAARRLRGEPASLPAAILEDDLAAIADELRLAAPAADDAARLRRGADDLLAHLDGALAAAVAGEHAEARRESDLARAIHDDLSVSATGSDVLPVWLHATDAMITAVTSLIDASSTGDRDAAAAAAAEFATVAEGAATADRALRIAIAEAAEAATAAPLSRIGAAMSAVEAARAEIAREDATP